MPYLTIFVGALLILLGGATSEAAGRRPTVGGPEACIGYDCEGGIICSCCFDDGCWICDVLAGDPYWKTCEWDPAIRTKGVTKIRPGSGVLDPGPPATNTKPYSVPGGGGVLSK